MCVILETLSILDLTLFGVKELIELYSVHSILNRRMDAVQLIQFVFQFVILDLAPSGVKELRRISIFTFS